MPTISTTIVYYTGDEPQNLVAHSRLGIVRTEVPGMIGWQTDPGRENSPEGEFNLTLLDGRGILQAVSTNEDPTGNFPDRPLVAKREDKLGNCGENR